jgi:hypothetical protein
MAPGRQQLLCWSCQGGPTCRTASVSTAEATQSSEVHRTEDSAYSVVRPAMSGTHPAVSGKHQAVCISSAFMSVCHFHSCCLAHVDVRHSWRHQLPASCRQLMLLSIHTRISFQRGSRLLSHDCPALPTCCPCVTGFVNSGGSYLGLCAGAYYACSRVQFEEGSRLQVVGDRELAVFPGIACGAAYPGGHTTAAVQWVEPAALAYAALRREVS